MRKRLLNWADEWNDIGYECYRDEGKAPWKSHVARFLLNNRITFRVLYGK